MNQLAIRAFRGRRKLRGCLDRMQRTRPTNSRRSCRPSGPPQCGAAAARYRKVEGLAAFNASPELFLGRQKQMLIERVGRSRDLNPLPPLGERKLCLPFWSALHNAALYGIHSFPRPRPRGGRAHGRSRVGCLCLGLGMYTEKAMARDYYPLIARAIARLEPNTADARRVVYAHARKVLREQVRDLKPALSISERMDEMLALEEAIRKVELEAAGAP